MQRNRRSSSVGGSLLSVCSAPRRSSINPKDFERIQAALLKRNRVSSQIVLFIILSAPIFIFIYNYAITYYRGSILQLIYGVYSDSQLLYRIFPPPFRPAAWRTIAFIGLIQYIFLIVLPHDEVQIQNSSGEREWKHVNGFASFILLLLLYILGAALGFYKGSAIYERWSEILSLLNLLSIAAVIYLYTRAHLDDNVSAYKRKSESIDEENETVTRKTSFRLEFALPTKKRGADPICDLFFGTELSPVVYNIDVKHFVTYRMAFSLWGLYGVSALYYNAGLYGKTNVVLIACVALQLIYIGRSQWYEYLHYTRLDSQIDKAGFYRIWGALVFLPTLYVTPINLLAQDNLSTLLPIVIVFFALSLISMYINTDIDVQRFQFRQMNGMTKIWGKDPFFISARFRRENGDTCVNLLLGSGWWSFSRHLNYVTEWLSFLFWTLLQGKSTFLSYIPLMFLAAFLYLRMKRDETRCLAKYGQYWLQYTNRVQYLLIPNVY